MWTSGFTEMLSVINRRMSGEISKINKYCIPVPGHNSAISYQVSGTLLHNLLRTVDHSSHVL